MNFSLKETALQEIFRLLSSNIDKANYLNTSLLHPNYNYIKIKQFLSEFEYDLKLIYDTLQQFQRNNNHFKKENNYLNITDRIKKHLNLNDLEESNEVNYDKKKKGDKKYSLTINILSDKYIDSKEKMKKKFNKSSSCKTYKNKYAKNIIKNLKKMKLRGNLFSPRNYEKKPFNDINDKKIKSYLTDYPYRTIINESNKNRFRTNINKNKVSLKHLNNLYNYYDDLLKKNNNNIYTTTNYEYSTIPTNKINYDNFNNDNFIDINNNTYSTPFYKTLNVLSSEENKDPNEFNIYDNNKDRHITDKNRANHFHYDYIRDYERNNNYMNQEITKKIISQILQDTHKLKELQKYFGNDIGQRLLNGEVNNKETNNIYDFIKKYENKEEKNLFRGSKCCYRNYKYDINKNKNDYLLFRDSMRDNKFNDLNYNINHNNGYNDSIYNNMPLSNDY